MTDPRIYQACLGDEADASAALAIARRFLAACGKPPAAVSVWASLAPRTLARAAELLPDEILSADISLEPDALTILAKVLGEEPQVHNWFLVQRASAFGAALGLGTPHPSRHVRPAATVSFDFGDDPVPEAIENGRFGRWLDQLATAGLIPAAVAGPRLMDRFAAAFGPRPTIPDPTARTVRPPLPPPLHVDGIQVEARGGRIMRGDRDWYWPGSCQLVIPVDPVTALDRVAPLFATGGPVEFHGYYGFAALGRTGLAYRLAAVGSATFVLHTGDPSEEDSGIDEATLDTLLGMTGDDLVCVDWRCEWPDAVPGYNGVQLTVNGVGNLHDDDPEHVPGTTAVYLAVHPRSARDAAAFAARMSALGGVRLRAGWG
jgi:hypothetical protein